MEKTKEIYESIRTALEEKQDSKLILNKVDLLVEATRNEVKYNSFCPLDYKYHHEELVPFLSAAGEVEKFAEVQAALMSGLQKFGKATQDDVDAMYAAIDKIDPASVFYLEKNVTKHDQNAVIRAISEFVPPETAMKIHPGTTSYDIIDSARAAIYKTVTTDVLLPAAKDLLSIFVQLAWKYADRVQIGRTHGQWTSPITFGYSMAFFANRQAKRINKLEEAANNLEGKVSGITGTHASPGTIVGLENALEFERYVLEDCMGIKQSEISMQITAKENLADLGHAVVTLDTVLADLSNTMRHLQRSEIAEVMEYYDKSDQVGSSADPGKRNPITFENVNGVWEAVISGQFVIYHLGVSDHQRDLRNSAPARFEPNHMICMMYDGIKRLTKIMSKIKVDGDRMDEILDLADDYSKTECLTAILKKHEVPDAHEKIRKIVIDARKKGRILVDVAREDDEIGRVWNVKFDERDKKALKHIRNYIGLAPKKSRDIAQKLNRNYNLGLDLRGESLMR
jgi:adenylosuccinate lyase